MLFFFDFFPELVSLVLTIVQLDVLNEDKIYLAYNICSGGFSSVTV